MQNVSSPSPRNLACPALPSDDPIANAAANKQKVQDNLYNYILAHTREPPILEKLRNDTAQRFPQAARMAVSPEQGAFLSWLVGALGVHRIIELGVFTGYSSVAMALALPPDGHLLACDRDPAAMTMAQEYWKEADVENKIEARIGPALDTLNALVDAGDQFDRYDFAFVDADKRKYREYYELLLKLVRPGGTIAIDNVLWYGKVGDPEVQDKATRALRELNGFLVNDPRVDVSLVPIGDGVTLCRRLK
ncbi:putative Tapetum-specific methyltransferase 1 [Nannochloris sp. 'desiccata']|nr:hypothetical protein KSW81_000192 [Chlorella desiccata (nom. nud.)]KAH7617741.1 putative Tapetum-specific methyltransferase 1 [Chlorella desiccata (nom. nud.)]KAH7620027.1 putative Tapetum-specific methyltransferase 1 [Chlorella desiccata (nom. nud.)]